MGKKEIEMLLNKMSEKSWKISELRVFHFLTSISSCGFPFSSLPLSQSLFKVLPLPILNCEGHLGPVVAWSWLRFDCATSCLDMLSENFVLTNNLFDY